MRKPINEQMKFGETDISAIEFDLRCRDEISKLLIGLQYIYCDKELREKVFKILAKIIPEGVDKNNGRYGMELWKILVMGTLRLNCNWDYDKLQEIANNHSRLRQMLGIGKFDEKTEFALQTLKDNVSLLTVEALDEINQVIVNAGHNLVRKKKDQKLYGRCDSFVVETNIHYPTDANLLYDAVRKIIELTARISRATKINGWRQGQHNISALKKLVHKISNLKRYNSGNEENKKNREKEIKNVYEEMIKRAKEIIAKAIKTIQDKRLTKHFEKNKKKTTEIIRYIKHGKRQIDQIIRRVFKGEKIPHEEKIFSIFEDYTDLIKKGKAGVPQEFGLNVCIVESEYGFKMHHKVMEKQTDSDIAVEIIKETKNRYPEFLICSFDKKFYSPGNMTELNKVLDKVILSRRGKLNKRENQIEQSEDFIKFKRKHSAVESGINALENHGLDYCPDKGKIRFKKYIALSIVAINIQMIGNIIQNKKLKTLLHRERLKYRHGLYEFLNAA